MGLFYMASLKERVEAKNQVFLQRGEGQLEDRGFQKLIYRNAWHGKVDNGAFAYNYYRLSLTSELECLTVHISRGDRLIQIFLNIFELRPFAKNLLELKGLDGTHFGAMPNSITRMQLRSDDYMGATFFHMLFLPQHRIGSYYTKRGFEKRISELGALIKKDMANIDSFVKKWHELHEPLVTDWEGHPIDLAGL